MAFMSMGACGSANEKKQDTQMEKSDTENVVATKSDVKSDEISKIVGAKEGMPLVVDFSAQWCPPCRQLKPVFHSLKEKYEGKVEMVTVDCDSMPELASRFGINSIPALVFFNSEGKEVHRSVGFQTSDQIATAIGQYLLN